MFPYVQIMENTKTITSFHDVSNHADKSDIQSKVYTHVTLQTRRTEVSLLFALLLVKHVALLTRQGEARDQWEKLFKV